MRSFQLGCLFAFLAVAAGAFGTHALGDRLAPDRLELFETAARYQMYHAIALILAAYAEVHFKARRARHAGTAFLVGILIFCGTVYGLALGSPRWFGAITPIGGLAFLTGWVLLGLSAGPRTTD